MFSKLLVSNHMKVEFLVRPGHVLQEAALVHVSQALAHQHLVQEDLTKKIRDMTSFAT